MSTSPTEPGSDPDVVPSGDPATNPIPVDPIPAPTDPTEPGTDPVEPDAPPRHP